MSTYKNSPKTDPPIIKINIAAEESGPNEKMIEQTKTNPDVMIKLPMNIQRTSQSMKQTGWYVLPPSRRDRVMAISIVNVIKANKTKNIAVSVENSVE